MPDSQSQLAVSRAIPQPKLTAVVFTTVSVLITVLWQALPGAIPFRRWDMWVWFVCCGVVLLSLARFSIRHPAPLPEVWLLSFPFLFEFFFQKICPTAKVASVDELLWSFDASFGYPQVLLAKLLLASPVLFWLCKLVWWSLPLLFVVLYLVLPAFVRRKYMVTIVCTGCIILPLYALCPGAGPIYLFRERFLGPLPALLQPHRTFLPAGLILNTTPSGHVAWALLLFWFAWKYCRKPVVAIFGLLFLLTIVATLGLGEHYVIDLIVSFPYAAAIWALVEKKWQRAAVFMTIVIAWLLALREGWAIPFAPSAVWLLCAVTILASLPWRELQPSFYASN